MLSIHTLLYHYLLYLLHSYYMASSTHFFFLNVTATTDIYTYSHTLPLHVALPISGLLREESAAIQLLQVELRPRATPGGTVGSRREAVGIGAWPAPAETTRSARTNPLPDVQP